MNTLEPCLYYSKMGLPEAVRVLSNRLQLDHTYFPYASGDNLSVIELKRLIHENVFDNVWIKPSEPEDAYVLGINGEIMYLDQWLSLNDFGEVRLVDYQS